MLGHRAMNMEDYLAILKRRGWIIAIPAAILPVVAVAATYFMTPRYTSSTLVLIDQQKVPAEFVKPVVTEPLDSRLAYMTEQILSRSSIEPIINQYNLFADQHLSMDARVDATRKALHIEAVQSEIARSNGLPGFKIEFTASDPRTAQQVCADITSLFTNANLKSRQASAEDTTSFIKQELDNAKHNLDDMDSKVAAFQRENFGMLPDDVSNNISVMGGLNSRLDADTQSIQTLEQNKSMVEALLAQATQPAAASIAAAQTVSQEEQKELDNLEAQLADLEAHYTPDYPDVRDTKTKIADLKAKMAKDAAAPAPVTPAVTAPPARESMDVVRLRAQLRGIDVEIGAKQKDQDALKRQLQGLEGRIQSSPQVEAEYKELTRDYQTAQSVYNNLLQKMDQSQMTTDLENRQEGEAFTVLDAASLPTEPTFPKRSAFAAGGAAAGIALGVLIVAFIDYRDTALRTERDVWELTHLPTLAVIALSNEAATAKEALKARPRRLFGRRPPNDQLAGA